MHYIKLSESSIKDQRTYLRRAIDLQIVRCLLSELHTVKQEVSALEAENAESENLRVTAEMKVVELEEQLEAAHKEQSEHKLEPLSESDYNELLKKIDALTQENSELYSKLGKIEEKGASDTGSTESFEAIQVNDRNDLLKKIEDLEQRNNELTLKVTKLEEKDSSHAGSTESFETINDTDRGELLKKIEQLTQENSDLTMKLSRAEEKGSSDTGSTESFERIPEHNESTTKIELLTQENHELVIKLTKLEEQLSRMESDAQSSVPKRTDDTSETLRQENDYLMDEISKLKGQIEELAKENSRLQDHTEELTVENSRISEMMRTMESSPPQVEHLVERRQISEQELVLSREVPVEESVNVTSCVTDDTKSEIAALEKDNARMAAAIARLEDYIDSQKEELSKVTSEKEELSLKLGRMARDDFARERRELIDKLDKLNREKESVAQERHDLQEQISTLLHKSSDEMSEMRKAEEIACQESQTASVASVENSKVLLADYKNQVEEMNMKLRSMETELREKTRQLAEREVSDAKVESLERELKETLVTAEEWKYKHGDMRVKMRALEESKASIEVALRTLNGDNKELQEAIKKKDAETTALQERLQGTIESHETRLLDEAANLVAKEREIVDLKAVIEGKDEELHAKYAQLQNEMIAIDNLQDELNTYTMRIKENDAALSLSLEEVERLSAVMREKEEEIEALKNNIGELNRAVGQSKPLAEFNQVLESLRKTETNYVELQSEHENVLRANDDLSRRIENVSKRDEDLKNELMKKEQEIADLFAAKEDAVAQIEEMTSHKTEAEKRNWELQSILDNQTAYVERVQSDLTNEYKQMEQLKIKHTEDITMLNRRLEDVIEDLTAKIHENEALKAELEQKEQLLGENVTEEARTVLEGRVAELEQKLSESEQKLQAQSEKMKKIVATFNKKKAACQELEARVAELEEKWTTEKDEKEVKNKKIQEVENSMREKDNKIADLEEKLLRARNDTAEVQANSEKLAKESNSLKEKMSVLMEQITEMGDEIEKQRAEMDRLHQRIVTERTTNEDIARQYDRYKETVSQENEQKQAVLDEVKEEARELSVRMQVMENEYVEQLALIKNLQAENGLLSSKQTQINEKLENAEKESEERRALIEQLQKRIAATTTVGVQTAEENARASDARDPQPRCDHSEQCQNLVQALETRLQERQAEIENLNNELANSYGNIVLLHDESLRYNDMMMQTAQERFNQSLVDRTSALQQDIDSLKIEKSMSEHRVSELEAELEEHRRQSAESKAEDSKAAGEASVADGQRQQERDDTPRLFDASKIFGAAVASGADASDKSEIARLQGLLHEKETLYAQHLKGIELLLKSTEEERSHMQKLQAQCDEQVGHWRNQLEVAQDELKRAERLYSEKVDSLSAELSRANELKSSQEQCITAARAESERLEQLLSEKSVRIDSLVAELSAVKHQLETRLLHADVEASLRTEISLKDTGIAELRAELTSTRQAVETLTAERDQQSRALESYKLQIDSLEVETTKSVNDSDLMRELEQRISAVTTERDLLRLQVNDSTRSLEELRESLATQRSLQIKLDNALQERDQTEALIANLTRALEDSQRNLRESKTYEESTWDVAFAEKPTVPQESEQVPVPVEEPIVRQKHVQPGQVRSTEKEAHEKQETLFDVDLKWDTGSSERLNVDEETWGWSAEDAQLAGDQHLSDTVGLVVDAEAHLRAQVEDLQDRIKDLEERNAKIAEESKAAQVKSAKLVKKLKEYKVQVESLQQQLKTQKQADSFFDLDTAIEEELKTQIANLEKTLREIKEEKKNIAAEKEALLKRLDVVVSANERYMEMKERQDMEVEVLRIQNKELGNKVQSLEWRLQENVTGTEEEEEEENTAASQIEIQQSDAPRREIDTPAVHEQLQRRSTESGNDNLEVAMLSKYKEEIDDLKDELEALAAENEQLQHFLEQQKATITSLESKAAVDIGELTKKLEILNDQHAQSQSALNKSKEEYDTLRRQYEQSLMDANDQVAAMRQNGELLKIEFSEKVGRLESEVISLHKVLEEKEALQEKLSTMSTSTTSLMQEIVNLKQELHDQNVRKNQVEMALQSEMHDLTRNLEEKEQELASLKQICSNKEHELLQQRSVETVSAIISEATLELVQKHAIEIEGKDKELHDLTEKLTTLQSAVDEYALQLRDSAAELETQQQQVARLKEDLTEQHSIIESSKANADITNEKLREKQKELAQRDEEHSRLTAQLEGYLTDTQQLQSRLTATEATTGVLQECHSRIRNLEQQIEALNSEQESILLQYDQETKTYRALLEDDEQQIDALKHDLREKTEQLHYVSAQLCAKENDLEGIKSMIVDKDALLDIAQQDLSEKRTEVERLRGEQQQPQSSKMIDGLPVFRMGNDDDTELRKTVDELKAQMEAKQQELEHLKYVLSENTYPTIIQQMQDRINCLYNEKTTLEASLRTTVQTLTEKQEQVQLLTQRINGQNQEHMSKEEANMLSRDRRSAHDQEEIVRLQNELHAKEQEINELQYVIAEKDSQLCLQASMEPQSDDFELRETVQRLTGELYGKEQEVQTLKTTIAELQEELSRLKDLERLSEESRNAIERLHSEKEQVRVEAEEYLNQELRKKEAEIGEMKQRLSEENRQLLAALHLKDSDIENLRMQLTQLQDDWSDRLQRKENELMQATDNLTEQERKLAELSITKDTMFHNLKMQINEKEARIEELQALSAEEERQLNELRQTLTARETELNTLKQLLEQKVSEYELIQHALKKDVSVIEAAASKSPETPQTADNKETVSNELDLALYMLHQRDVRCEELTHELMQLLQERDTLQLRLSNAIRVNEELRRASSVEASPTKDSTPVSSTIVEPIVEQPSPSKSEGPVEIAKEAIDDPIENKEILALK